MVARKRYVPQAQGLRAQVDAGFSRLNPEVFSRNRHAGLYAVKVSKVKVPEVGNGKFNRARRQKAKSNHFCKKNVGSSNVLRTDGHVLREIKRAGHEPFERLKVKRSFANVNPQKKVERKIERGFTASEELMLSKKLMTILNQSDSLARNCERELFNHKEYILKLKLLNEMMWTNAEVAKKLSKARSILISNQVFKEKEEIRKEFCRKEWVRNLKRGRCRMKTSRLPSQIRFNNCSIHQNKHGSQSNCPPFEIKHTFQSPRSSFKKCRHQVFKHPDGCRYYSVNYFDNEENRGVSRSSMRPVTIVNQSVKKHSNGNCEFAAVTIESKEPTSNKEVESEVVQNPRPTFSFSKYAVSKAADQVASNARNWLNLAPAAHVTDSNESTSTATASKVDIVELTETNKKNLLKTSSSSSEEEGGDNTSILRQQFEEMLNDADQDEQKNISTPLMSNSKIITHISTTDDDGDVSAVSSIPNSSSVHKAKISTTPPTAMKTPAKSMSKRDFVSMDPNEKPLRTEGLLPIIDSFDALVGYFEPFMIKLIDLAEASTTEEFENEELMDLVTYIQVISNRIKNTLTAEQYSHLLYLEVIESNVQEILNISQENQARVMISKSTNASSWIQRRKNLKSVSRSVPGAHSAAGSPDGDDSDDDNSRKKAPRSPGFKIPSSGKKRRSTERRAKKAHFSSGGDGGDDPDRDNGYESSSSSEDEDINQADDSTPNDGLYRRILKELMKASKNYKIKELSMASDPSIRRERFNNWIIDLRNILSTHSMTLGILDDYPAFVPAISYNVDRAVKALLASITVGMAKQIVGSANSASKALEDLKRNYGQTSSFDIHRERKKMMLIRQQQNEKASEFLRRVRKQMTICANVGCTEYIEATDAEANIVNIILGGLDSGNKLYAATIAELKARYRSNPLSLTFVELEELFFNIDDNSFSSSGTKNNGRKEHANFIVGQSNKSKKDLTCHRCGKKGHFAKDCRVKLSNKSSESNGQTKKDLSKVKCFKCGQMGHFANKCSNQSANASVEKKVTIESAHIAKEGEESCKLCGELGPSKCIKKNFDFENNFRFKFQNSHAVTTAGPFMCVPNHSWLQHMFKNNQQHLFESTISPSNRHTNSFDQNRVRRNFTPSARANKKCVKVSEPYYVISNAEKSATRGDISFLIEDLETRDIRGQNCRAKSNESICIKSYNFINLHHLSVGSYPHAKNFNTRDHDFKLHNDNTSLEMAQMAQDDTSNNNTNILPSGDLALWLFDSGATSHFTPVLQDLINAIKLDRPIYVKVADGSTLRATHQGMVSLSFISDQGIEINLKLMRVLHVPGLQTRLFSIESFVSDGLNRVLFSENRIQLQFPQNLTMTIELPHQPPSSFPVSIESNNLPIDDLTVNCIETAHVAADDAASQIPTPSSFDPIAGGENAPTWLNNDWEEHKWHLKDKRRISIERAHHIFGHRSINSLLWASKSNVWDDVRLVAGEDVWCDSCKVSTAPKHARSKAPLRFNGRPLQHMFIDIVPSPGQMRGVKGYNEPHFLFLCDPISRYADKKNLSIKSTKETIKALTEWRNEMLKKGFELFIYLRSDAGTNFTSEEFKTWCRDEQIKLSIAGPKHQEQNAFAETTYNTVSKMARAMLVHAHLPIEFYHFALDYALLILRVLPAKNLVDEEANPITTYQLIHHLKPRVSRFKVFGCPVVFKRYQPFLDGKMVTDFKQLQQGSRGIFVGFPRGQAGWLIYVPEKIQHSHLVVSMDVVFDQDFVSGSIGSKKPFAQSQPERDFKLSTGYDESNPEMTGDVTNLMGTTESHWGDRETFESQHKMATHQHLQDSQSEMQSNESESEDESESDEEPIATKKFEVDLNAGSQQIDGFRRSKRLVKSNEAYMAIESLQQLRDELMLTVFEEYEAIFHTIATAAGMEDIPIAPYLPEPKSFREIQMLPEEIKKGWIKAIVKELLFLINNGTFEKGVQPVDGDEVVPCMIIYKAKVTSRGFLDKLKARCVARGDLQFTSDEPETLWSPCVFARTFKMFVAEAVRWNRPINQLDFIGAFCQAILKVRLFVQLPIEYAILLPEFAEYFNRPLLLKKSIYGLNIAAKVWNEDLMTWLTSNETIKFHQSEVDPSLYIFRRGDEFIYLIIYVDDCLYFGSSKELESKFEKEIGERFHLETQGWTHWFLGTRIYREENGSYLLDQESYIRHILNRYCGKESRWGLPPMQKTPAPVDYFYSKSNRPKDDSEREAIKNKFEGLSMASAVSSLLYAALNTRPDILWITNKLAKSSSNPGLKDFEALLHVFGYLRCFPDYGLKFYSRIEDSPVYDICNRNKIEISDIIGFSDSSWQDCPDSGRSTCGYKVFVQGGLVDAQSTMPIPVALSSAEAEYMGACNLGTMVCHLRELKYEFENLGSPNYKLDGMTSSSPSILLIDNQATVRMSKNYKITSKNRHVGRRWHFVRRGVKDKLFNLKWIPGCDQLADDCTKIQPASKAKQHFERTLIKVPDKVKGFRSDVVGNR